MHRFAMISKLMTGILFCSGLALADYTLDFNISAPTLGSINYAGGQGPLVGNGISVDSLATDNGTTLTCVSCFLNFSTGNLASAVGSLWSFGSGGSLSLTGTVQYNGNTVSGTLLSGFFNDAAVVGFLSTFKVAIADFMVQNAPVGGLFGVPINSGNFNISFSGITAGQGFTSTQMGSGDILAGTPEPASIVLLGTVLLGCVAIARRRMA
jgi:hypothetical protein